MARVFLRPLAKADLREIAGYTEESWGRRQRNAYLKAIGERFRMLAATPALGTPRD